MAEHKFDRHILAKQLDIPRYFKVQEFTFNTLGINILSHESHLLDYWKVGPMSVFCVMLTLAMAHFSVTHWGDITAMAEVITPLLEFLLTLGKVATVLHQRKTLVNLVHEIEQMSMNVLDDERVILIEENRMDTRLSGIFYVIVNVTYVFAMLAPLLKSLLEYLHNGKWQFIPVFRGTYIVDYNVLQNYIVIYIGSGLGTFMGIFIGIGTDCLFSWYIHNIAAQFRILAIRMQKFAINYNERDLISWILTHDRTIRLAGIVRKVFTPIIFLQFALNSTQICVIAFQMNDNAAMGDLPFLVAFLIEAMIQPLIYCYGGQRLENESDAVSFAVYSGCNWLTMPVRTLKIMQLAIMRAQKTCKLSGFFFEANYSLYLWVVRTAASYVTLMRSLK